MVSVVLTAHLATGHGRPTTQPNGNQMRLIVAALPRISKKLSLETSARVRSKASVVNTVGSAVGLGTPTMLKNGLAKVLIVGARIGGENDRTIRRKLSVHVYELFLIKSYS